MAGKAKDMERRFWRHVAPKGAGDCWEWRGSVVRRNYGMPYGYFRYRSGERWTTAYAHRVSFYLCNQWWPDVVMHTCDNPRCVNPGHLRAGTHRENMEDASAKGRLSFARHNKGGKRAGTKNVPPEIVAEIRRRYEAGEVQRLIALDYGITQAAVSSIVRRRTRSSV